MLREPPPLQAQVPRPRVFLHIGAPKTGSTYLQELLWHNRAALRSSGVFLPGSGPADHFRAGRDVRRARRDRRHAEPAWDGAFENLAHEIESARAPTAIISDERLSGATRAQIDRVMERLNGFEIHVVYGIRDFSGLLASEWQQTVKHGNERSFHTWLRDIRKHRPADWFWRAHDVEEVLGRWAIGRDVHTHVFTLPHPSAPRDEVWRRLQAIVGWDTPTEARPAASNTSLGFLEASLLSRVQGHVPPETPATHREAILHGFVAEHLVRTRPNSVPILIPETARPWVDAQTERRIGFLRSLSSHVVGSLDELADSDRRFGDVSTEGHESEMLDAAIDVIGQLVALEARTEVEAEQLRSRRAKADGRGPLWRAAVSTVRAVAGRARGAHNSQRPARR